MPRSKVEAQEWIQNKVISSCRDVFVGIETNNCQKWMPSAFHRLFLAILINLLAIPEHIYVLFLVHELMMCVDEFRKKRDGGIWTADPWYKKQSFFQLGNNYCRRNRRIFLFAGLFNTWSGIVDYFLYMIRWYGLWWLGLNLLAQLPSRTFGKRYTQHGITDQSFQPHGFIGQADVWSGWAKMLPHIQFSSKFINFILIEFICHIHS